MVEDRRKGGGGIPEILEFLTKELGIYPVGSGGGGGGGESLKVFFR